MAINRTNKESQYYNLDNTLVSDANLTASQTGGIGVGAKLKSLSTGDYESGVDGTVVNAYDIDWAGYKVNGNDIKSTGALIEEIEKGGGDSGFDYSHIDTGYNAAMKSSANPNSVLDTKRGQFISGYGNTSKNSGTITSGMNNINGMNMGIVLGRDNNTESASTQGGVCSCVIGGYNKLNVTKSTSTYDFIQGRKNTLTSVNGNNVMFGQYSSVNGSVNRDLGGENSSIVGEYNSIISPCADRIVYTFTKQSNGVYLVNAKPNYIEGEVLLSGFPIMISSAIDTELITNYTAEKIEGDNDHILLKTSSNITTYLAVVVNSVKANKTIVGNGFADADKAIALGLNTFASGEGSIAIGEGTRTTKTNEVALGAYNNSGSDTLFSVGNGDKNSLHNIFEITTEGKVKVNDSELFAGNKYEVSLSQSSGIYLNTEDYEMVNTIMEDLTSNKKVYVTIHLKTSGVAEYDFYDVEMKYFENTIGDQYYSAILYFKDGGLNKKLSFYITEDFEFAAEVTDDTSNGYKTVTYNCIANYDDSLSAYVATNINQGDVKAKMNEGYICYLDVDLKNNGYTQFRNIFRFEINKKSNSIYKPEGDEPYIYGFAYDAFSSEAPNIIVIGKFPTYNQLVFFTYMLPTYSTTGTAGQILSLDSSLKPQWIDAPISGGNSAPITKSSVNSALNSSNINAEINTNNDVVDSINSFYGYYADAIDDKLKKPRATTNEGCVPVSRGGEDRQVTWKNLADEVTDVINNNMVVLSNAEYEALGSNLQNNITYFIYD